MPEVLLTGSSGIIGSVIQQDCAYTVRPFDLPEHDVRDKVDLRAAMDGCDAVIHLAWWDMEHDNFSSGYTNPDNFAMAQNVYETACQQGVGRVIMASSIHADTAHGVPEGSRRTDALPLPDSPYGATKVGIEAMGRYFSTQGLEVVCIRFGWVSDNKDDRPRAPYPDTEGWLSHSDCQSLINRCLAIGHVPKNYQIVWGLSRRVQGGVHNLDNTLGWQPQSSYYSPLS